LIAALKSADEILGYGESVEYIGALYVTFLSEPVNNLHSTVETDVTLPGAILKRIAAGWNAVVVVRRDDGRYDVSDSN
jgi:hypothetical protein